MRAPTDRQVEVLEWIRKHIRRHGMPPTRTEIAQGLGLADASSVTGHLKALVRDRRIEILPKKNRGIRILDDDVPLLRPLGEVAAGSPIICEAHIVGRVPASIAEHFRPQPDFLLTVRGDSMENAGIRDGDLIAVHRTSEARTGQIIVARFGDEVTMKRFVQRDDRHVELRPESSNPAHTTLELDLAKHLLQIEGVVVGAVIRGLDDTRAETERKNQHR